MNYLFTLRYDGTRYHGFQIQANAPTIQGVFQDALYAVLGGEHDIKGCSRTDSGVHARMFCVSVAIDRELDLDKTRKGVNALLPPDVRVMSIREVPEGFHARYSCKGKRYVYLVCDDEVLDPFLNGRALHLPKKLDVEKMDAAAKAFVGKHDFSAFCSVGGKQGDNVRTITEYTVARREGLVEFSVAADGFLYNMVRITVGTLLNVSRGKLDGTDISRMLETGVREQLCETAPPQGLYLDEVFYEL